MRCLRRTLPVSAFLVLAAVFLLPVSVEAEPCGSGYRGRHGSHHGRRRLRISRVRGHRHGTHRLHRGYVTSSRIRHTDHPSTWYPSYSPRYRHYSQGSRHGYTVRYGSDFYGYGREFYGDGRGGRHRARRRYRGLSRGSYCRGYREVHVLYGHRRRQGPVTQAEPWRARMERAVENGAFVKSNDTGMTGTGAHQGAEASPRAEAGDFTNLKASRKRGRIEYRGEIKSSPSKGLDKLPSRDRSSKLKRLRSLVLGPKRTEVVLHKRGHIRY